MAAEELPEVIEVWYQSLAASLAGLRPEQRRTEAEYRAFFRDVVAPTRELWVIALGEHVAGVKALLGDELERLYIEPSAQRRGLGSLLVEHAQSLHPGGLWLVTHQTNTAARRFYEGHGFVACAYGVSPAPESEPDVEYRWPSKQG
jgi:ribosomal protein S18 acetylase RimI-like enzyme